MSDAFDTKLLSPMLIAEEQEPFDSPDYRYELKLDGVRCLVYLGDGKAELRNKRKLNVTPIYPELADVYRQVKKRSILDGELTVIVNGKPQFAEIQRRALMSNPFKIKLAAESLPVNFTAFDILYYDGTDTTKEPLEKRQALLRRAVSESSRLAVSRVFDGHGKALFDLTTEQGLEGVVAKCTGSLYFPGKQTKDWVKFKNLLDDDFVVCGYIDKGARYSLIVAQYDNGVLKHKGHVTMGLSNKDIAALSTVERLSASPIPGASDVGAIWIEPKMVCVVQWMPRSNGALNQPVLKGFRDDKAPADCIDKNGD